MRKYPALLALGLTLFAVPVAAHHIEYLDTPFASRGECEAQRAALSNDDDFLIDQFPNLFSSEGEVRSFLNRAFTCERVGSDWFITDHRVEVLASPWFVRRL